MGPMNQPPMVTAQGYTDPTQQSVGAATAPMDQNAMLADLLRRRSSALKQAQLSAGNSQMWGSDFQRPQFSNTIRGYQGQPDQVVANWGDILGKGISNYMGAKERKQSLESTEEAKDISNQFMQTTLASDPAAQKLYGLAQAGVSGADKALVDHMAPKKQAMAVMVQGLTSGMMEPEMASQLAPKFGLDPEVVRNAAVYASKKKEEQTSDQFAQKSTLLEQQLQGKKELQSGEVTKTGYTKAELAAMPVEQRIAAAAASTGRETAESKARGKARVEAELELPKTDYAMGNIKRVISMAEKADYWPGNFGMKGDKFTTNQNNVNVRQALAQLTLDANGGKLGAGFSNADRDFMREAQVNLESGNVKTATYQLGQLVTRLEQRQKELRKAAGMGGTSAGAKANSNAPSFDELFPSGTFQGE